VADADTFGYALGLFLCYFGVSWLTQYLFRRSAAKKQKGANAEGVPPQ
jgi:hypothetical protein